MKALSIRQPWAWLIVNGIKPVENRTWPTSHRGRVIIHASQVFEQEALEGLLRRFPELRQRLPQQYDLGGIVGSADVAACVQQHPSPYFTGPYGFVMAAPRVLPFHKWPGKLGLFEVPDQLVDQLQRGAPAEPQPGQKGLFA